MTHDPWPTTHVAENLRWWDSSDTFFPPIIYFIAWNLLKLIIFYYVFSVKTLMEKCIAKW